MEYITNLFDDERFFEYYKGIRANPESANEVEEKPALFSLTPDLSGKAVLDLGCGFGENCAVFRDMGADCVTGVDISERMLESARESYPDMDFVHGNMEDLSFIDRKYDVIFSSLAMHYISDFDKLCRSVSDLLADDGVFIFSQEHPLTTAPKDGVIWTRNDIGEPIVYNLTDYSRSGKRIVSWHVDGIVKYHRTFSDIVNTLIGSGFAIEKMLEPSPTDELLMRMPQFYKQVHKPNFLLIRARKVK